jgi:hypothetical protein
MAGQNHKPEGPMTSKSRALERARWLNSARLRFMILSGHDSVGSSGLGFCKSGKLGQMPVHINPLDHLQSRVMQNPGTDFDRHSAAYCGA